jgi:hypothetical protein
MTAIKANWLNAGDTTGYEPNRVKAVLNRISFIPSCVDMDWEWEVCPVYYNNEGVLMGVLINTTFQRPDINTGKMSRGTGRKWYVEKDASVKAIVMTAWMACNQIVTHEMLEAFCVDGVQVFDPHKDLSALVYPEKLTGYE